MSPPQSSQINGFAIEHFMASGHFAEGPLYILQSWILVSYIREIDIFIYIEDNSDVNNIAILFLTEQTRSSNLLTQCKLQSHNTCVK